jgi:hypothetical protein
MRLLLTAITLAALTTSIAAQWLNHPTPGIPRTADGKPNVTAPAPHTLDGHPDFTGLWNGPSDADVPAPRSLEPSDTQPWVKDLIRQRRENFFKDRPRFQCLPEGPENVGGWKRILQTPSLIAILNEDLTYRQVFMDGRKLETAPNPTWTGYSVGRWEGDTLVVDSFGFNERTWLNDRGLPHTEALTMRERYRRPDFGHLQVDVTFTDPGAYTKPWGFRVNFVLAADTEMLEAVCEERSDQHWVGKVSDVRRSARTVPQDILATYVGVYRGTWLGQPRTVEVTLASGELLVTVEGETLPLMARSNTLFESAGGLSYEFVSDGSGAATHVVEIHVSGNYPLARLR